VRLRGEQFLSEFVEFWASRYDLVGWVEEHPARLEYEIRLTDPVVDEHFVVVVSARELAMASYDREALARALYDALTAAHRQMVARAEGAPA
jgi:hypothetical protein